MKKILITGASGGLGRLTVLTLLQKGHQVAASILDINGKDRTIAEELKQAGAKIIEIDVTNEDSVTNGVKKAISDLKGLDVLINNAGLGVIGIQELFTPTDFQKIFDINVFGVQRMNRAVVPYFREKGEGLIIYTSSILGRIALPFYGTYQASKWALEALAENYRVELSIFGIENCIVEPGGFLTSFSENLLKTSDIDRELTYGDFAKAPENALKNSENLLKNNPQQDPQKVADAFSELIDKPKGEKPFRTVVDFIGMGEHVQKYNDHLEQIMLGIYSNSGNENMLRVKK
ncbi:MULTISPECIES: SDR family oxidoreductase [Flavobacterium]|uniref:Diacetyl reductase [(S)-acetoin forming] n=2 Tax=Flavobacterium TaxID=237 RepID=A0A2N9PEF2_9FLAO|nr:MULTISPECIES: SDR family oxidoreductase [Flavobacterium]OWP82966.1 short-chain dehydrogenase [Flavobacterium davisii]QYS88879.1 SDR family oxidoreductase [Flavobacterium davisii]RVU90080.1 SDR family oxidoreductase [Flavobacterium columnare]SPE78746.1 Diacetyl reductase [(S)-acetoin forming] [Flavobacterium columnare]